jgi:diaminopimelate decarboxylase
MEMPPSAAGRPALAVADLPAQLARSLRAAAATGAPIAGYWYDGATAEHRAQRLRAALPEWAEVCFAVKANSHLPVLARLAPVVDGFEVASESEAVLADAASAGLRRNRLVAAGPAKSDALLATLVEAGAIVTVESVLELHRLAGAAAARGRVAPALLRVNPQRVPVTGSLVMGGTATQFGVPEADLPAALSVARALPHVDVVGFHVHAVCQNLDAAAHAAYVGWCVDWSCKTAAPEGVDLRVVDVGGGIGVPFEGEGEFDVPAFGRALRAVAPPPGVRVVLEPGRWLTAEAGWYAADVVDVKTAYGTTFVVLRGGINHFQLPTSWDIVHRFAVVPVERWPAGLPRPQVQSSPVTVVGPLCTTEDTLARDVTVDRVRSGDIVVFPYAGAYGWEFAMPAFLGHPPATRRMLG